MKKDVKIEYPNDVKSLKVMLLANQQEVSRLSHTVTMQAEQIHHMGRAINKWEERFDQLLAIRR